MQRNLRGASIALVVTVLALVGCAESDPMPTPTAVETPSASPTPEVAPELIEGGTAGQNRPYFEYVLARIVAGLPEATTEQIVNRLEDAGFDRGAMQATPDRTPAGYRADQVLLSVEFDDQCLLASVSGTDVVTQLVDVLGSGTCLVGETASID